MTKTEAIKELKAMERTAGIRGVAEIENIGEVDKATACKVYGKYIISDARIDDEITKRQREEEMFFGKARTYHEIQAEILTSNDHYRELISKAPEKAEEKYRVVL